MTAEFPQGNVAATSTVLHTLGALLLAVVGFIIGAGGIALAATVIRSILPPWLTGFTDWAPVAAPIAGVLLAAAGCQRFTPNYSRVAVALVFAVFGLLSVVLAVLQPWPQPAAQSLFWSLAFLVASAVAFVMPALEQVRTRRAAPTQPKSFAQSNSQNTDAT